MTRFLIEQIHESPYKAVMAVTGGGAEVIGELLRYGGGSATLLDAAIPYDPKAFDAFVKGTPDKYCSPGAARDLAMAAFQRAVEFAGRASSDNLIGLGASSSLAKDGERKGREHHAYIAVQTARVTMTLCLGTTDMECSGARSRQEQETHVSRRIIEMMAIACGVTTPGKCLIRPEIAYANDQTYGVVVGNAKVASYETSEKRYAVGPLSDRVVFSGSFNPWHDCHGKMAQKAFEMLGKPVDLEITVRNVDKPALNYSEIDKRLDFLPTAKDWSGMVHLTSTPTFLQKAEVFRNSTFVMGYDTFERMNNKRYGDLASVAGLLKKYGAKFLVFHRLIDGASTEHRGGVLYLPLMEMATIVPSTEFEPVEVASSEIRRSSCS